MRRIVITPALIGHKKGKQESIFFVSCLPTTNTTSRLLKDDDDLSFEASTTWVSTGHHIEERKTERIQQYSKLSDEEKSLSAMTGSFSLSDGIKFERVPSEDQILQVKNHIVKLKVCILHFFFFFGT